MPMGLSMAKQNKKPKTIEIYKAEREAGIANLIESQASIAYVTQLEDTKLSQEVARDFFRSSATDVDSKIDPDQFDLFYLNTVLVTTGCNKNLDVFTKEPTWAARYSPIHKQFNLEHDQSKIIGHMTSARAVNEKFELIDDDTSPADLPDKFHILTGAVIYRALSDEQAQADIEKIIEEIAAGVWYVSMECLFRGFDYAVIADDGEQKVIARNEESAWLTKHLRQYGGSGAYNGYTLGRVLNDITFSGKGLVRKPANPESIIFNESTLAFKTTFASLGYITSNDVCDNNNGNKIIQTIGNINMASEVDPKIKELETKVAELIKANELLNDKVKTHESSATTAKITGLESEVTAKATRITELEIELKTVTDAKAEVDKTVKSIEEKLAKAEKEIADSKALEVTRSRIEKLTKLFAPEDEAKQIVSLAAGHSDEQFDSLVALFAPKWKKLEETPNPTTTTATTTVPVTDPPVNQKALDDAIPVTDATLASTNQEVETTRASMTAVLAGFLGNGRNKKYSSANVSSIEDDDEE